MQQSPFSPSGGAGPASQAGGSGTSTEPTDLTALINLPARNGRRNLVIAICFLIVAIEGFDAAIIGFVAPQIAAQFGAKPAQMSMAISAGMLGLMLGYMLGGPQSDKHGRHPVLLVGTAIFGLASIGAAFSNSLNEVIGWRLATGFGIGVAMPALSALLGEILPTQRRGPTLSGVFCGFLFGSAAAGILTGQLIEGIGWHGMFVLGGIAPLLCVPAIYFLVPESPQFLLEAKRPVSSIHRALTKIGLPVVPEMHFQPPQAHAARGSLRTLFSPQLCTTTVLVWALMFLILGSFYVIASWLPTLLKAQGASVAVASKTAALFQTGGLAGAVTAALLISRIKPLLVIWLAFAAGAIMPWVISSPSSEGWYLPSIFAAGLLISGPIVVLNAVIVMIYPTTVRSLGAGSANSMGRLGSFVGAGSIGWLVQQGVSLQHLIAAMSLTVALCAALAFTLYRTTHTQR